jgi:hypothetical protein
VIPPGTVVSSPFLADIIPRRKEARKAAVSKENRFGTYLCGGEYIQKSTPVYRISYTGRTLLKLFLTFRQNLAVDEVWKRERAEENSLALLAIRLKTA